MADQQPDTRRDIDIYINYKDIACDQPVDEQGAMSFVITGRYGKQRVILKKPLSKEDGEWNIDEFENELQHLLSIRHKNVVALHGITKLPKDDGWWLVLEFCEKGNLADCLHIGQLQSSERNKVSVERKLQCVVDIAAGMNICHINNPPILHRDLKNANIFVNSDWVCKVGDFGLSQNLKHRNFRIELDKLGAAGTSQYYPPEILRAEFLDNSFRFEKAVSTKSDVWAFGLMLWEIFTEKKAWQDFLDEIAWNAAQFSDELCNKGRLPPMDKCIPLQIQPILTDCLKTKGDDRPSFAELVDRLTNAMIEYSLAHDPIANTFWQSHWLKHMWDGPNKVEWTKFKSSLKTFLNVDENHPMWDVLQSRITLSADDPTVTLSTFEKVLYWFGPLKSEDGDNILSRIEKFLKADGFHFRVILAAQTAVNALNNEDPGTFLLRLNEGTSLPTRDAPWTLSVKGRKGVTHHRIANDHGKLTLKTDAYQLKNSNIKNLFELVHQLKHDFPKDFVRALPLPRETSY